MSARIVLALGTFRSGSTWVFNSVRLLAIASGQRVATGYSDDASAAALAPKGDLDMAILKSHAPTPQMLSAIAPLDACAIATIRDPRDCVCSFMSAFAADFDFAARWVTASCHGVAKAVGATRCLVLRYEDGFTDSAGTIDAIADHVALKADRIAKARVFGELERGAVARKVSDLTARGVIDANDPATSDPETQLHPKHVGDGRIGKYRDLLRPDQIRAIETANSDFMASFGYA